MLQRDQRGVVFILYVHNSRYRDESRTKRRTQPTPTRRKEERRCVDAALEINATCAPPSLFLSLPSLPPSVFLIASIIGCIVARGSFQHPRCVVQLRCRRWFRRSGDYLWNTRRARLSGKILSEIWKTSMTARRSACRRRAHASEREQLTLKMRSTRICSVYIDQCNPLKLCGTFASRSDTLH